MMILSDVHSFDDCGYTNPEKLSVIGNKCRAFAALFEPVPFMESLGNEIVKVSADVCSSM